MGSAMNMVMPTAGCSVRTPAKAVSSPSMAQSSTHMVLRAIELDWSLLDPTPLYVVDLESYNTLEYE